MSDKEWFVLRHVEHEHIGTIAQTLAAVGVPYRYVDVFRNAPVPRSEKDLGGLIVMGGPMGVYESDRYPFLKNEQELIRRVAGAGLPVLGICLGSQLIASAFGGKVYPGPRKEIGWHPVEVTAPGDSLTADLPRRFMGFHWHGDTFDLPSGAVRLFQSDLYQNQGFRCGQNVLALQFHCEVTPAMIEEWLQDGGCQTELSAVQDASAAAIRNQTKEWGAKLEEMGGKLFSRFFDQAGSKALP